MLTNKDIRKKRTLIYFIEAAQKIIEEEGFEKVTIRKVADLAGYNSATLYNYFDNLNHLILFASLKYLNLYNVDVAERITETMTEREKIIVMWESFCKLAFKYPRSYAHIFFDKRSADLSHICKQYYDLFPEEMISPVGKLTTPEIYLSLLQRNKIALENICIQEQIDNKNVDMVNDLMIYAFKGLLFLRIDRGQESDYENFVDKTLSYFHFLLNSI